MNEKFKVGDKVIRTEDFGCLFEKGKVYVVKDVRPVTGALVLEGFEGKAFFDDLFRKAPDIDIVKRYDHRIDGYGMQESPTGEYVKLADVVDWLSRQRNDSPVTGNELANGLVYASSQGDGS